MFALLMLGVLAVVLAAAAALRTYSTRESIRRKCRELTASWDLLMQALRDRSQTLPKLVSEVKRTTGFEENIFHEVEAAARQLAEAETPQQVCDAILAGRDGARHLDEIAEYYPPLARSQNYLALRAEATETEVRIERERGIYNRTAQEFNDLISNTTAGRNYAKRTNLLPNEKIEHEHPAESRRPSTAPIRLTSALG